MCLYVCVKETPAATWSSRVFFFFYLLSSFDQRHDSEVEHLLATQQAWVWFSLEQNIFIISWFAFFLHLSLTDNADILLTVNDDDADTDIISSAKRSL